MYNTVQGTSKIYIHNKLQYTCIRWTIMYKVKDKGKVIPLEARCGPEGG